MLESSEIYYVVLRGSARRPIFADDEDRRHFTGIVADCVSACAVQVHAYCWTSTEARLAVKVSDQPIGAFAQALVELHAKRLVREPTVTGSHLEQQRYRGVLIDGHSALLDLVRHIHLAPVKSGLVRDPGEYAWSSHRAYLGLEDLPWLTTQPVLALFAPQQSEARQAYADFILRSIEPRADGAVAGEAPGSGVPVP